MAAALAHHSLHPVSKALVQSQSARNAAGQSALADGWKCDAATEVAGQGVSGVVVPAAANGRGDGAVRVQLGSAAFCGVSRDSADNLQVYLSDANGWLATFSLKEDVRPDALQSVQALTAHDVAVHLLSGDSLESVTRVALQVGIADAQGGCSPADKLAFLRSLQSQGRTVAMVGDGLNDGPVLAGAHVSFAFGQAVPLAQAQSDFVVMGDKLTQVAQTVILARKSMAVVRQNLWWALLYNAACVPLAVLGLLPAWLAGLGMATSSLIVVLNALRLARPMPLLNTQ
jgi:Cu2+-exporting ATPase